MSLKSIDVITIHGEKSTWRMCMNLGTAYRPIKADHPDKVTVSLLKNDVRLQTRLTSMMPLEVADMTSIVRKNGTFGVLYRRHFDCAESDLVSVRPVASRRRVIRRIQADLQSELSFNPRFPKSIDIGIPEPHETSHNQVALWIFVPHTVFDEDGVDYDVLEDVIALLME